MTITLKDRLSHLTYRGACKLLGPEGDRLIRQGGKYHIDIDEQVTWGTNPGQTVTIVVGRELPPSPPPRVTTTTSTTSTTTTTTPRRR